MTDQTFDTLIEQLTDVTDKIEELKSIDKALDELVPRACDIFAQCMAYPTSDLNIIKRKIDMLAKEDYIESQHMLYIRADLDRLRLD